MKNKIIPNLVRLITLSLLCGYFFFSSANIFATDAPSETIKRFYRLISEQQCKEAVKLRPDYSLRRCKKISKTHIHKVSTELSDDKNAVVLLELDSYYQNKKSYFFGYVRLSKKDGNWLIVGPFKSREDYWLDEYVKTYIPDEFKGLSESEKKRKFVPPPAPGVSSMHNTQEEGLTPEEEEAMPPGDSIDADEFALQPLNEPKNSSVMTEQQKLIVAKDSTSLSPEAQRLVLGADAIEGNYTTLLLKIRKYFPSITKGNMLLIDKSRHTIYVYNKANLLLAFFPILSSDNSHFPSGLYRITSNSTAQSSGDGILQRNLPIILKNIPIKVSGNDTQAEKKRDYYIRDLFDINKKDSLQLSPIDLSKLQQFISPSTIAYSGQ